MMQKIIGIVKKGWQLVIASMLGRRLSLAEREAKSWKRDAVRLLRDLSRAANRLDRTTEKVRSLIEKESDRNTRLHERVESLVERHEKTEEALTAELRIYKDVVIPAWTLNFESLRVQSEADIALQAQRRAAYSMPIQKGGEG